MKNKNLNMIIGNGINYLISAALIISGLLKLIGFEPYKKMIMNLSPHYFDNILLLGITAVISGILFLIPRTFILGLMASLVFLGGTIAAHMQHGDSFIPQLVFVLLTILTAYLKKEDWFRQTQKIKNS